MGDRQDSKIIQKELANSEQENQPQSQFPEIKRAQNEQEQNGLNLSDLSPFITKYSSSHNLCSTYHRYSGSDMTIIETPANNFARPSYMQQIDENIKSISGVITWAHEEESQQNDYEAQEYDSSSFDLDQNEFIPSILKTLVMEIQNQNENAIDTLNKNLGANEKDLKVGQGLELSQNKSVSKGCNCKKSQCLKLYCDCFRENRTCVGCNCVGCHNTQEFQSQRVVAMEGLMDRNPDAFRPKIETTTHSHSKGCNCKKSGCQKKYCQCYQAGLKCGDNCKCEECKNGECSSHKDHKQKPKNYRYLDPKDRKDKKLFKNAQTLIAPVGTGFRFKRDG